MRDSNDNMIPDRIDRVIVAILGAVLAIGQAVQQYVATQPELAFPAWAGLLMVGISATIPYFVIKGRPGGGKMGVLLTAGVLVVTASACHGPYDAAWRTMDGVIRARDMTAQGLASYARDQHRACLDKHGAKTQEYATCIKPAHKALRHWRQDARPSVDSALQVAAAAVQIAERADMDEPPDYIALLRPAVCALLRVSRLWGHYYPDQGKAVLGSLEAAGKVVCQ